MFDSLRRELGKDYWAGGYTDEMVDLGCARITRLLNLEGFVGEAIILWDCHDCYGFCGDSKLYFSRRVGNYINLYRLTNPLIGQLNQDDLSVDLDQIRLDLPVRRIHVPSFYKRGYNATNRYVPEQEFE